MRIRKDEDEDVLVAQPPTERKMRDIRRQYGITRSYKVACLEREFCREKIHGRYSNYVLLHGFLDHSADNSGGSLPVYEAKDSHFYRCFAVLKSYPNTVKRCRLEVTINACHMKGSYTCSRSVVLAMTTGLRPSFLKF